ncbi:MAG TPA: hypothetical protein VM888_07365, partial [Chitinophagaceae bacterium]|nr:hypothetical protein [Chitinophagaceae bacterium]
VYKNGEDIGDIHFNWKGHIIIKLKKGEEPEKRYVLAAKGFWNFRFVLATQDQQDVLVMTTAFKWSKLHFEYVIKLAENVSTDHDIMELILCCGYGANLYMTTIGNAS